MLVCNVSLAPRRGAIAADIAETALAADSPGTGNVVFATLVDDPASVREYVDAYLGEIMVEAASAAAVVNAGLTYAARVDETASAADVTSAVFAPIQNAVVLETATAVSVQDASVPVATVTWDAATVAAVTLSGGNLVATNTGTTSANQGAHVIASSGKTTGKYYFEVTVTSLAGGANRGIGIGTTASTYTNIGGSATTGDIMYLTGSIWANGSQAVATAGAWSTPGLTCGIAVDLDNRKIWFRQNSPGTGNWNNAAIGSQNPAVGSQVGGVTIPAGTMVPFAVFGGSAGVANNVFTANFGASAFSGTVPSGFTSGWPV